MANTEGITLNGVSPTGNHEPHYGDEKRVYDNVTLGDYDPDSNGNGNSFDVASIYGFARLLHVDVQVDGTDAYYARYDYANNTVRVFNATDGTEVAQGTTLDIDLRVRIEGTGT